MDMEKAVLRVIFIMINTYKKKKSLISNLTLQLKELEKKKTSPKIAGGMGVWVAHLAKHPNLAQMISRLVSGLGV